MQTRCRPSLEVGSHKPINSPSGVWGEAPADKRYGAHWSQRVQLWWQQFLLIFANNKCANSCLRSNSSACPMMSYSSRGTRHHCPMEVGACAAVWGGYGSPWLWRPLATAGRFMLLISFSRTLTVMLQHFVKYSLTLLSRVNRTLTLMLHHFALSKCSRIKHIYEVLCAK